MHFFSGVTSLKSISSFRILLLEVCWSHTLSRSKCSMWYLSHEALPLIGLVFWVGLSSLAKDLTIGALIES